MILSTESNISSIFMKRTTELFSSSVSCLGQGKKTYVFCTWTHKTLIFIIST